MTGRDETPKRRIHPAILARARELRREMTPQERRLWACLRKKQLYGLKFRRQHPIYRFILDFYCHQHRLAVEIDGPTHAEPDQQAYDHARTEWLNDHGVRVSRFTNNEIDTNLEGVLYVIARECGVGGGRTEWGGTMRPKLNTETRAMARLALGLAWAGPPLGMKRRDPRYMASFESAAPARGLLCILNPTTVFRLCLIQMAPADATQKGIKEDAVWT